MVQGTVVVSEPRGSMALWGAKFPEALQAMGSVCGCDIHWWPQRVHQPNDPLSRELTACNAAHLRRLVVSPHWDAAWLERHRYCWLPVAASVISVDASPQEEGVTNVAWL